MRTTTTGTNYEADHKAAWEMIGARIDLNAGDGNQRNWSYDALNDSWEAGITIEEWVERALRW